MAYLFFWGYKIMKKHLLSTLSLRSERGMTLIEIIVVIVIIGLVSTFLLSSISSGGDQARKGLNKAKMTKVKGSIDQFRITYGSLPNSIDDLYRCTEKTGPGCMPVASKDDLADVWGKPYVYSLEGNGRSYKLKTLGADGQEGGEGVNFDDTITGP